MSPLEHDKQLVKRSLRGTEYLRVQYHYQYTKLHTPDAEIALAALCLLFENVPYKGSGILLTNGVQMLLPAARGNDSGPGVTISHPGNRGSHYRLNARENQWSATSRDPTIIPELKKLFNCKQRGYPRRPQKRET